MDIKNEYHSAINSLRSESEIYNTIINSNGINIYDKANKLVFSYINNSESNNLHTYLFSDKEYKSSQEHSLSSLDSIKDTLSDLEKIISDSKIDEIQFMLSNIENVLNWIDGRHPNGMPISSPP